MTKYISLLIGLLILTSCIQDFNKLEMLPEPPSPNPDSEEVDLLAGFSWEYLSGADQNNDNSLVVKTINRKIRPKSGNNKKWYLNPPVNLAGPQLKVESDFNIKFSIDISENPDKWAYLDLYGTIPICFDEWRVDGENIRIGIRSGSIKLLRNFKEFETSLVEFSTTVSARVVKKSGYIFIYIDDLNIVTLKDNVFVNNSVCFGVDAESGGGFVIEELAASGTNLRVINTYNEIIKNYPEKDESLRSYSETLSEKEGHSFWIGTAVNANALLSDRVYSMTLAREFNMLTPEFDFKFQAIHPLEDTYAWGEADLIVDFAEKNNMRIHGHTLVWHEAVPKWVWDYYDKGDKEKVRSIMKDHIRAVMGRYKGRIKEWDLLNEIFSQEYQYSDPYGLRNKKESDNLFSIWYWAYDGPEYILDAIRTARDVDPDCELWINEFATDQYFNRRKLDNIISLIDYIKDNGQRIDGIGFQAHNYDPVYDPSNADECLDHMKIISAAGVKVRISELDVAGASENPDLFADKLQICTDFIENPGCTSLGLWGFTDKYGSMSYPENEDSANSNYESPNWDYYTPDSLPFDENYNERSAYKAMIDVLKAKI